MAPNPGLKPGQIKDAKIAALFSTKDPELRFDDLKEIGHGSFGAVFYAYDKERGETVAIKKMSYSGKQAAEKWADVIKEVQFLTSLRHEHIVEYRASFLKDSTCWLVMEYCIGSAADLVDVLKKGLREVEIAAICHSTLSALAYLHSLGRIHRDVKAGNILLNDAGCVKLADFGSASMACPARTFIGTPFFMAPEVILAMDDGEYAERADIWSLGITAIELAERRPPLFNMNAMSALYHIAQNEPPTLEPVDDDSQPWSNSFRSFVDACLKKEPSERMTTRDAQQHSFVRSAYAPHVVLELIARTKRLVRELNNNQYRKMRKLMYLDERRDGDNCGDELSLRDGTDSISTGGGRGSTRGGEETADSLSLSREGAGSEQGDDSGGGGGGRRGAESPSSRSVSLTSLHSLQSTSGYSGSNVTGGGAGGPIGVSARDSNATMVSVDDDVEPSEGGVDDGRTPRRGDSGEKENREENSILREISAPPEIADLSMRNAREDVNTLRRSKFATLRTTKQITREQEEAKKENNLYEQMNGYKRLRQGHIKEVQQLEERGRIESEALRMRLEREMDASMGAAQAERMRLRKTHANEADKRRREVEDGEKRLRKQIMAKQTTEMAACVKMQLKEYKYNKELARSNMRDHGLSKSGIESRMKDVKAQLAMAKTAAERTFEERQRKDAEDELTAYKKACMARTHMMEEKRDEEEHDLEIRLAEARERMLYAHHSLTADQERSHLKEVHSSRTRHQRIQHDEEMNNQKEYERRTTDDLQKRHAMQSKQQPRELKVKEAMIRKQYRQAVKTQTRQFKVWQTQLLAAAGKDEQREIAHRLKEEQKRKLAMLGVQYESQIESMVQEKTVKLEAWQEEEARTCREKLALELKELQSYQETQKRQLENTIEKERERLEEKIAARKEAIDQRISLDRDELRRNREKAASVRADRHASERALFDPSTARVSVSTPASTPGTHTTAL